MDTLLLLSALLIGISSPHKADGWGQLCCYWDGQSQSLKWAARLRRGLLLVRGSEEEGDGGAGAPVDGTDISGQVVPKQWQQQHFGLLACLYS